MLQYTQYMGNPFRESTSFRGFSASVFVPLKDGASVDIECMAKMAYCSFMSRRKVRGKMVIAKAYFSVLRIHVSRRIFHYGNLIREEHGHEDKGEGILYPKQQESYFSLRCDPVESLGISVSVNVCREYPGHIVPREEFVAYRNANPKGGGMFPSDDVPRSGRKLPLICGRIFVPSFLEVAL